jgi:Ner family transcriptional regulator
MDQNGPKVKTDPRVQENARISVRLKEAGYTLEMVAELHALTSALVRYTMRAPNPKGERAIAAVLKTHPHLLWPSRYRPNGERRKPQDWTKLPTFEQRRKSDGGRT